MKSTIEFLIACIAVTVIILVVHNTIYNSEDKKRERRIEQLDKIIQTYDHFDIVKMQRELDSLLIELSLDGDEL